MRLFLFLLTFFALSAKPAHAWEITAYGGINYAAPTEKMSGSDIHWTGNSSPAYGLSIADSLWGSPFELESGLFLLTSNIEQADLTGTDVVEQMTSYQLPILLRFNFDPWISIAAGGYFATSNGNINKFVNSSPTSQSYGAAGLQTSDAGLLFSLKAKLHINESLCLAFDARYEHGLKNVAVNSSDLFNTRSIQVFAGLSFQFDQSSESANSTPRAPINLGNRSNSE